MNKDQEVISRLISDLEFHIAHDLNRYERKVQV